MPVLLADDQKLIFSKILHMKSKSSLPVSTYSVFNFLRLFATESLSKLVQKQSQTVGKGWTRPRKRRECDVTYLTLPPVKKHTLLFYIVELNGWMMLLFSLFSFSVHVHGTFANDQLRILRLLRQCAHSSLVNTCKHLSTERTCYRN